MLREAFRLERAGMSGSYDFVVTARSHEGMPLAWYREAFAGLAAQLDAAWRRREREGTRRGGRG
jgi:RNase P protein component